MDSDLALFSSMKLFDSHLHIIEPDFPLVSNNGFLPDIFTCADYVKRMARYNLAGGAIVSGSFQAFDQTYLIAALKQLGPSFVGVTQLPSSVTDEELIRLNSYGVRAIRFNLKRGGSEGIRHLESMARRVYDVVGWHIELYVDSSELSDIQQLLVSLPSVSIDHLGLSTEGFSTLLKLAEKNIRIKATGFSRGDLDIPQALRELHSANPYSLMFGTDLPSTRAPEPYTDNDFSLVFDTLGEHNAKRVFYDNAANFYRLRL